MDSSPAALLVPTLAPEMAWAFESVREAGPEVHLRPATDDLRFMPVFEFVCCSSQDNVPDSDFWTMMFCLLMLDLNRLTATEPIN